MLSLACCCTQTCCIANDEHIACPNTFRWQASLRTCPATSVLCYGATALDYGVLTNFPDLASGVSYGRTYGLLDRWLTVARPLQTTRDFTGLMTPK